MKIFKGIYGAYIENEKQKMINLLNNRINLISKQILKYTPQLYYIEKNYPDKTPKPLGSSVLYASETNNYLITAKHVFNNENEWSVGILIKNIFYALEGIKYQTTDNNLDIAVFHLTERLTETLLESYSFLNSDQIDENHYYTKLLPRYLEVGFPLTKSKLKKHDKTIRVNPFILVSDIIKQSNEYIYVNIPKTRKSFNDNIPTRTIPILTGLSGSGLWYVSNFYRLNFKLVGIMIEWDDKNKKYTKGTKINFVTGMIKEIEKVT